MNALSTISIIIYTSFFIGAYHMLTTERKSILNFSASAVLLSLGWWSFCNSFFFAATTQEQAWFWHKLSSIGWCGFVSLTVYYFLALTKLTTGKMPWWKHALFFTPTIILIFKNLFGKTTSLAQNVILSTNGWGWTYENSIASFWLWAYLCYVAIYFGMAFYLLHQWGRSAKHKLKREMAIGFIVLDTLTILGGLITDVILPLTSPFLPALASIATAFFGVGYFTVIYKNDLFNINLVISSNDILQISNNPIFVIDENKEILRYNYAAGNLLCYGKSELMGANFMDLMAVPFSFNSLYSREDLINVETKLRCKDQTIKDVLLSAASAKDKRNSFLCIIVSCQDVSKQKKVQNELRIEREKYKKLATDYQLLAYYDPLTNLPNRRHFFDKLNNFEKTYHSEQKDFTVIFLDLDNFKKVNDIHGHKGGDELLIATANKLRRCTAKGEFVARLGGDEFIIIMPFTGMDSVEEKVKQIQNEFSKPILFNGMNYTIGISAGYSIFSKTKDIIKLMQKADEAMYENKKGQSYCP